MSGKINYSIWIPKALCTSLYIACHMIWEHLFTCLTSWMMHSMEGRGHFLFLLLHPQGLEQRRALWTLLDRGSNSKGFFVLLCFALFCQGSWEVPCGQEHRTSSWMTGPLLPPLPHSPVGLSSVPGEDSTPVLVQGGHSRGRVWLGTQSVFWRTSKFLFTTMMIAP